MRRVKLSLVNQAERDSLSYTRVALIDDDMRLAQLMKVVLEEASQTYDVQVDGDVVRAYDFVKRVRPDLIILDIMMGVDAVGFQTLEQLSQDPDLCRTPVVVSSAGIFPKELYELFNSPIVFLPKPFQLTELVAAVHSMAPKGHSPRVQ
jgi:CheY-like chemotaxis protein